VPAEYGAVDRGHGGGREGGGCAAEMRFANATALQIMTPEWPAAPGHTRGRYVENRGVSLAPTNSPEHWAHIGDSPEAVPRTGGG